MKAELENKLYQIDPVFFEDAIACKNNEKNEVDTCMYFGCECGDGWFEPLSVFVEKVKILNDCLKQYNSKIVCTQLKEKFGELTIYHDVKSIDVNKLIGDIEKVNLILDIFEDILTRAEKECWNVCEYCGAAGGYKGENLITTTGWIKRICKTCNANKNKTL